MRNSVLKKVCINVVMVLLLLGVVPEKEPLLNHTIREVEETAITQADTRASYIEWRYSIIGGKEYKRLLNVETGEWLTDWILCE